MTEAIRFKRSGENPCMSAGVSAARAGNIPIAVMLAAKAEDRIRCLIMFRPPKRLWLVANSLDGRDLPGQVPKLHGSRNDARALRRGEQSISVGDHYGFLIDRALARSYRSSSQRLSGRWPWRSNRRQGIMSAQ